MCSFVFAMCDSCVFFRVLSQCASQSHVTELTFPRRFFLRSVLHFSFDSFLPLSHNFRAIFLRFPFICVPCLGRTFRTALSQVHSLCGLTQLMHVTFKHLCKYVTLCISLLLFGFVGQWPHTSHAEALKRWFKSIVDDFVSIPKCFVCRSLSLCLSHLILGGMQYFRWPDQLNILECTRTMDHFSIEWNASSLRLWMGTNSA